MYRTIFGSSEAPVIDPRHAYDTRYPNLHRGTEFTYPRFGLPYRTNPLEGFGGCGCGGFRSAGSGLGDDSGIVDTVLSMLPDMPGSTDAPRNTSPDPPALTSQYRNPDPSQPDAPAPDYSYTPPASNVPANKSAFLPIAVVMAAAGVGLSLWAKHR